VTILANPWRVTFEERSVRVRELLAIEGIKALHRAGGRELTVDEALEFATRRMAPGWPATPEARGRGRPRKTSTAARESHKRRRALYVRLKLKPENARLQARTTAREAKLRLGDDTRGGVARADVAAPGASTDDIAELLSVDPSTVRRARRRRA
jgi:hypothetical protein